MFNNLIFYRWASKVIYSGIIIFWYSRIRHYIIISLAGDFFKWNITGLILVVLPVGLVMIFLVLFESYPILLLPVVSTCSIFSEILVFLRLLFLIVTRCNFSKIEIIKKQKIRKLSTFYRRTAIFLVTIFL